MRTIAEHLPRLERPNGWTRTSAGSLDAAEFANGFSNPGEVHHKALLEATERAAPALGYRPAALRLLRYLHDQVRAIDWQDGRPICFASNEAMAYALGVTTDAIKKQLRSLRDHGLITRTGSANGQRRGGRIRNGPMTGHLEEQTSGENLSPLAMRFAEHCQAYARYAAEQKAMQTLAKRAMAAWRDIQAMNDELAAHKAQSSESGQIIGEAESIMALLGRARARRCLTDALPLSDQLEALQAQIRVILRACWSNDESLNPVNNHPMGGNNSTHIPITIPSILFENVYTSKEASSGSCVQPKTEQLDTDRSETHTGYGTIKASELPYLFEGYREFVGDYRTFDEAERRITNGIHSFIGLKQAIWLQAIKELPTGYAVMMFAFALDFISKNPEKNGGAYFIGCWRKYQQGTFKPHGTVMARRKKDAL